MLHRYGSVVARWPGPGSGGSRNHGICEIDADVRQPLPGLEKLPRTAMQTAMLGVEQSGMRYKSARCGQALFSRNRSVFASD